MVYEDFYAEEPILSPEKEVELRAKLATALAEAATAKAENAALKAELFQTKEQLALLKKMVYGQRSEKTEYVSDNEAQLSLFNEAEQEESRREREAEQPIVVPAHTRKKRRTHEELAAELPVEEVVHPVEETVCSACGGALVNVGKEFIRDELCYVPARLFVRKHYAQVMKCGSCGMDEAEDALLPNVAAQRFVKAAVPAPMIPHSFCSPELLAHIAYEKYVNGMPLYRLEKDFAAHGVLLSRATMANWLIHGAKTWLQPLWMQMRAELLTQKVLHADETVVQVLHEPGRKAKTESRMWVYCSGELGRSNILFEYQPTRHGDHARQFLDGFGGFLVCDGYAGYNKVSGVTRCGCWAHARRKFVEALPTDRALLPTSQAAVGVDWCNRLFALERKLASLEPEERKIQRQERIKKPILDGFFAWLETVSAAGGTKLAKAVAYAREQRKPLSAFLEDGLVPISNNRAENAIRPFVVGRKQWLFCDSVKGAECSAIFYSLAASANANGFNVEQYFTRLFQTLPAAESTLDCLPWRND